jgi:aromatic ring hydroxylase
MRSKQDYITGFPNRFTHIHQNKEYLHRKQDMIRAG